MLDGARGQIIARQAVTGAILGALCAVAAYMLGVQQLTRDQELSFFIGAAIFGGVLGATRLRALLWIGAGLLVLLCCLVDYTPLVPWLADSMIRRDPVPQRVDAIAALGAGVTPEGWMRSEKLDRVLSGLELQRRGVAPTLMVSRERARVGGRLVSDSVDLAQLMNLSNAAGTTIFVDSIFTTRTEALRMKRIADARGWRRIAVVTSPLHTRRACATFEAVGFQVVCVPAELRGSGLDPVSIPEDRFRGFRSWLYEVFATDSYRRRGWIR
ncbi:MAG TPA: YdcF family protein [Gemmatimonadaceae bacterium]|nr:YdcF family protein [Gemmatimonadaceae bacterium]